LLAKGFKAVVLVLACSAAAPAQAQELFGGVLAHDVDTFLTKGGYEDGADLEIGWRGKRLEPLRFIGAPSPYVFGSLATGGETHFAAAGLSWRIGGQLFVRPGIGLAIHNRDSDGVINGIRTDLGSRITFEPEVGIGYQVSPRLAVEASWVHLSHAQLFSAQNPGMDSIGVRLSYRLR
jgi:lipid A 3-O-deacylase